MCQKKRLFKTFSKIINNLADTDREKIKPPHVLKRTSGKTGVAVTFYIMKYLKWRSSGEGGEGLGGTPNHPSPTPLRRRRRGVGRYSQPPFSHSTPEKEERGWEVLPTTLLPLHSGEGGEGLGGTPNHPSPTPLRRRRTGVGRYSQPPFSHSTPEKEERGWEVLPTTLLPLHSGEGGEGLGGTPNHPSPTPLRRRRRGVGRYSQPPFSHSTPENEDRGWEVLPTTLLPLHSGEGGEGLGGTPNHPSPTPLRRRRTGVGRYSQPPFSHSTPEKEDRGWEVLPTTLLPLHSGEGGQGLGGTPNHPSPTPLRRRRTGVGRYSQPPFSHSTPEKEDRGWEVLPTTLLPLHSGEGGQGLGGTPNHPSPTPLRRTRTGVGRYSQPPFSHSTPENEDRGWEVLPTTLLPLHSGERGQGLGGTPNHPSPTPLRRTRTGVGRYSQPPFSHSTPENEDRGWEVLPTTLLPLHSGERGQGLGGTPNHPSPTPLRRTRTGVGRYSQPPFSHSTPENEDRGWEVLPTTLLPLHSGERGQGLGGTPNHPSPTPLRRTRTGVGRYSQPPFSHSTPENEDRGWEVLPTTLLPLHSGERGQGLGGTPNHPSPTPLRRTRTGVGRYSQPPFSHSTPENEDRGWEVLPTTLLPLHSGERGQGLGGTPNHPSPTPLRRTRTGVGRYSQPPFSHSTPENEDRGWEVLPTTLLPLHSGERGQGLGGTPNHPSPTPLRRTRTGVGRYSQPPFSHSTPENEDRGWEVLPTTLLPLHSGERGQGLGGTPNHPSPTPLRRTRTGVGRYSQPPFSHSTPENEDRGWEVLPTTLLPLHSGERGQGLGGTPNHPSPTPLRRTRTGVGRYSQPPFSHSTPENEDRGWEVLPTTLLPLHSGERGQGLGGTPNHPSPTPLRRTRTGVGRYSQPPFSHSTPENEDRGWEVLPTTLLPLHSGERGQGLGGTPNHPSPTPLRRTRTGVGRYSQPPFSHSTPENEDRGWEVLPTTLLPLHSGEGGQGLGGTPNHPSPTPLRRRRTGVGRYSQPPFSHSTPEKEDRGWEVLPTTLLPLHSGEGGQGLGGTPNHPSPTPLRRRRTGVGRYSQPPFSHSTPEKEDRGWEVLPTTLLPLHSGEGGQGLGGTPNHPSPTPLRRRRTGVGRYSQPPFSHSTPEKEDRGWEVLPTTLLPLHSGEGGQGLGGTPNHPSPTPLRRRRTGVGRYSQPPFSHSTPEKEDRGWEVLPTTLLPLHSGEGGQGLGGTPNHPSRVNLCTLIYSE